MSRLFEELERERAAGHVYTLRDWLARHPPPAGAFRQTLAGVARRALGGESFFTAVREFLDEFSLRPTDVLRSEALRERPPSTADVHDAYLVPEGWLNDAVKGFLVPDPLAAPVLDVPGLGCLAASPRHLLALKVLAHRVGEDEEDVRLLAEMLGLGSASEVVGVAEEVYGDRLDTAARFFVEELFDARG